MRRRIRRDRKRGRTLRAIADRLSADLAPTGHGGGCWHASTVHAVLSPRAQAAQQAPHLAAAAEHDDDETGWAVLVDWTKTVPAEQHGFTGRYGSQDSATKLTHAVTRETALERLGITADALEPAEPTSS